MNMNSRALVVLAGGVLAAAVWIGAESGGSTPPSAAGLSSLSLRDASADDGSGIRRRAQVQTTERRDKPVIQGARPASQPLAGRAGEDDDDEDRKWLDDDLRPSSGDDSRPDGDDDRDLDGTAPAAGPFWGDDKGQDDDLDDTGGGEDGVEDDGGDD
jgi:hypothetical protein